MITSEHVASIARYVMHGGDGTGHKQNIHQVTFVMGFWLHLNNFWNDSLLDNNKINRMFWYHL